MLGDVVAMHVWGTNLVSALPGFDDDLVVEGAGLVAKDLVFDNVVTALETLHDVFVGRDVMAIVAALEGFDENSVGVAMVSQHDVLVAAARVDREAIHVIYKQLPGWLDPYVELAEWGWWRGGPGRW